MPSEERKRSGFWKALSRALLGVDASIDSAMYNGQRRTLAAQRQMFWQSALLVPLTLVAIVVVTLAIGRPLGHIDRVISELGSGNYSRPIAVSGPTDLERLGHQLEWLRARLLDHAQERSRFLRHMSHELKTPLANIREGTELLMDGAVGELQNRLFLRVVAADNLADDGGDEPVRRLLSEFGSGEIPAVGEVAGTHRISLLFSKALLRPILNQQDLFWLRGELGMGDGLDLR